MSVCEGQLKYHEVQDPPRSAFRSSRERENPLTTTVSYHEPCSEPAIPGLTYCLACVIANAVINQAFLENPEVLLEMEKAITASEILSPKKN